MNRRMMIITWPDDGSDYLGLIICGALFVCGCIVGTVAAGFVSNGGSLYNYISSYISLVSGGASSRPQFLTELISAYKYHLLAVFFGFSLLGIICVPALSAVRGFFLCFSISAIVRLFGGGGVVLALSIFGLSTVISIPCFFVLAVGAFSASLRLLRTVSSQGRNAAPIFGKAYYMRCGICFALLTVSAIIDTYLTPVLVGLAASHISI